MIDSLTPGASGDQVRLLRQATPSLTELNWQYQQEEQPPFNAEHVLMSEIKASVFLRRALSDSSGSMTSEFLSSPLRNQPLRLSSASVSFDEQPAEN